MWEDDHERHGRLTIHGVKYIRPPACSFGDYDNSSEVERANVLAVLRLATGVATFDEDSLMCSVGHMQGLSANYIRYSGSLDQCDDGYMGIRSTSLLRDEVQAVLATTERGPGVIHVTGEHGFEEVWIAEWFDEEHTILDALEDYPLLDDHIHQDVEWVLQRSAWKSFLRDELCGELLGIPDHGLPLTSDDELDISDAELWSAFTDVLSERGDWGHFENTSWCVGLKKLVPLVHSHLKQETLSRACGQGSFLTELASTAEI